MPVQFDYPEQGWSTGNMRMAQGGPNPQLSPEEWQQFTQEKVWGFKSKEILNPVYAGAEHKLEDFLDSRPDGFVTSASHKGLKGIRDKANFYSIPQPGFEDAVFVKIKDPVVAKMLPTSQQAGQVVEQAAGRQKGKRKEAEAM